MAQILEVVETIFSGFVAFVRFSIQVLEDMVRLFSSALGLGWNRVSPW